MPITRDKTRERLLDKANNLVEEIKEYKVNGGENPIRDRLVLESLENLQTLIVMLFEDLHNSLPVSADIEILKKHDIIGWVTNNKILAALLFMLFLIMLNAWFVSDFRKPLLILLGLPPDLINVP